MFISIFAAHFTRSMSLKILHPCQTLHSLNYQKRENRKPWSQGPQPQTPSTFIIFHKVLFLTKVWSQTCAKSFFLFHVCTVQNAYCKWNPALCTINTHCMLQKTHCSLNNKHWTMNTTKHYIIQTSYLVLPNSNYKLTDKTYVATNLAKVKFGAGRYHSTPPRV